MVLQEVVNWLGLLILRLVLNPILLTNHSLELSPVALLLAAEAIEESLYLADAEGVEICSLLVVWLGTDRAVPSLDLLTFVFRVHAELLQGREHLSRIDDLLSVLWLVIIRGSTTRVDVAIRVGAVT